MWLRNLLCALVLLLTLVPPRTAEACGPDFPHRLLADRVGSLSELPAGSFRKEAGRLVPIPADPFRVVEEAEEPPDARKGGGEKETALYAAGAKAFKSGDAATARARFRELLALPAEERQHFSTFAAFMLGRNAGAGFEQDMTEGFELTRQLVRDGFDDPLGLAVASLGEQARRLLEKGDDAGAIQLYAEQAAHGSQNARSSLFLVAHALAGNKARLNTALKNDIAQRLMAVYVWTRSREWYWEDNSQLTQVLEALAQATESAPQVPGLSIADKLAAGAWRGGRFDLAERFASVEKTPLAAWVQAKLALRRGDTAAADKLLEEAAGGIDEQEDWMEEVVGELQLRPYCRVEGERGVLALARGDFDSASERVLSSCSWPDLAYVAERVLTVDELQRFVTQHPTADEHTCKRELESLWYDQDALETKTIPGRLRLVLARRLLRAGKSTEALEYFKGTRWEEPARKYADALATTQQDVSNVKKAEAFHEAAKLARREGLGILGTEVAPDWGWVDGMYDISVYDAEPERLSPGAEAARKPVGKTPLVGAQEQQRAASHAPPHANRYHYRLTASVLAQQGAELLPKHSQAYAMMLCQAARYAADDPKRFQELYRTYLKYGAANIEEPWSFGQECHAPAFERALSIKAPQSKRAPFRRRHLLMLVGGMLIPIAAGAAFYLRRKRQPSGP
ncbi:hypothetical protein MYSTI_06084 [Myxococcus stipitatus DSM 14675]|uniref:Uncharacterized protein n=1 Tax=Myxococcus stipitatus (strain DSM 14675 / JCM 12634 / Mx s8) TaxID=1278073 RepID=L7UII2_MYXSD|nr:hypothetical protein [Myxococcus stipitatus]AGC47357.1 hypothetical protein MYSTI_06084 [Myxococcus stipitatus DSM 14675]